MPLPSISIVGIETRIGAAIEPELGLSSTIDSCPTRDVSGALAIKGAGGIETRVRSNWATEGIAGRCGALVGAANPLACDPFIRSMTVVLRVAPTAGRFRITGSA